MSRNRAAVLSADLDLSEEQLARLGMRDGERARVLAISERIILLERTGGQSDAALPFDRDLVLTADVRAFSLADMLSLVNAQSKSGFLYFSHRDCVKTVYLHAGEVVFATSNQRVDRMGEFLLRTGAITPEQHREANERYKPGTPFGRFLVRLGFLSPRELWDGVKGQVEEIVRSLFAFELGTMLLWEGEIRPDNVVRLALPTQRLVEEGLGLRDELLDFIAFLEDSRTYIEPVEGAAAHLGGTERALLDALDATSGFAAMCRRVGLDSLSGARTVRLLDEMGALRIARVDGATEAQLLQLDARSAEEDQLRATVRAHAKLLAELGAPIVAMEGAESLEARLSQVVQDASLRHPELLAGIQVGPGGSLDPDALIQRALSFPGDRDRAVRLALGELISYLEFELFNHPKIEDAEDFLEGVEALRSRL